MIINKVASLFHRILSTVSTILGWMGLVFGSLFSFIAFNIDVTAAPFIIIAVLGAILLWAARDMKKRLKRYNRYIDIIVDADECDIETLANSLSVSYSDAQRNVKAIIDLGLIKDIHVQNGMIKIKDNSGMESEYTNEFSDKDQGDLPIQKRIIRCPGCGANNVVTSGVTTECEYCGTPITY